MGEEGLVLAVLGAELSPFEALTNFPPWLGRIGIAAGLRGGGGDSALEDWRLQEGLMKGEYTFDVVLLGWLPGHTRRAVATDLGEGLGTRNDRG